MMGRVCPAPCQTGCNRNDVDTISSALTQLNNTLVTARLLLVSNLTPAELSGKKVAIVGGGPAGMAAAYQLRRMGYYVYWSLNNTLNWAA